MGSALVLSACGGGGEEEPAGEPEENGQEQPAENGGEPAEQPAENGGGETAAQAEQLYQQSCVSCHGQNLEGGVGPDLTTVGSRLSKDEIENIIVNGQATMPAGLLQGEEAAVVAEWLAAKK